MAVEETAQDGTKRREDSTTPGSGFGPKLRERKDGAAVPLDDLDKRLLNLMQGQFRSCRVRTSTWRARPGSAKRRS